MGSRLTSKEYWDAYWGEGEIKHRTYDASRGLFWSYRLLLDYYLREIRRRRGVDRLRVIDCGSGEGLIMRFLAEQFEDIDVYGIEYSDAVHKAERLGRDLGLDFNLIHGDLFAPWDERHLESFDLVLSCGLIEHFDDPLAVLQQMMKILRPGGALVSIIPNFDGLFNVLWRAYDRDNYAYHKPIPRAELTALHRRAGVSDVRYYALGLPTVPGVHDPAGMFDRAVMRVARSVNRYVLRPLLPRRQASLDRQFPMVSTVACAGFK
jgi:SAM-dependent methyltransferase